VKERKLLRNIFLTVFVVLTLTNIVFLYVAFSIEHTTWLGLFLAITFALLETTIIVILNTYYNDLLKIVGKNTVRTIRLENLNHPLLLKLSNIAPGTYNHSLNVAQLSTKAAKSIGLDEGFIRIGAYFHDIGKLRNPKIFNENGIGRDLKTDDLKKTSRQIIDHVTYGQKLAREYNLPDEAIEYISQHHGSSEIYSLKNKSNGKNIIAQYPGPKPLTRQAAILMLADSVEARVKGLKVTSDENITRAIESEFTNKLKDGQLEYSGLSVFEIKKIKESFQGTMNAIYHRRKIKNG